MSFRLKNLKKKLNDIVELQKKVDSGAVTANPEQKEKLSRRAQIEAEIKTLEKPVVRFALLSCFFR